MHLAAIAFTLVTILAGVTWEPSFIDRAPYEAPSASHDTWNEILAHPADITVRTYSTGVMETERAGIVNLDHQLAGDLPDDRIDIPVVVGLVDHREFGPYLVDAGLDSSYVDSEFGTMRGMVVKGFLGRGSQAPGQDIASVLERQGTDINGVFLTHLHFDHTAGIIQLPKDIPYVVGAGEPYRNFRYIIRGDHLAGISELHEISFNNGVDLPPLGTGVDLFGDGSFWAISSSGHSPGHVMYFVNGIDGQYLLTGDACNNKEQFETGVGPGFYSEDVDKAQVILDRIIEFKELYPSVTLIFGHDLVAM